jgi:hypothetical protein
MHVFLVGKLLISQLKLIFLGDFPILKMFLSIKFRVTMTTTLKNSCWDSVMPFVSNKARVSACMHA